MSNKPVYCRITKIRAVFAIDMIHNGRLYLKMPGGEMQQQRYQPGMGHAVENHVKAFPRRNCYYIKTSP